jgi:hypothetical protein
VRYKDYVDVYSKDRAKTLAPHRPIDHTIDQEWDFNLPDGRTYNVSEVEFKSLQAYIETNLANGFIQRSSSAAAAPTLFAKKRDGRLQLCVDIRPLNKASVKNRYSLRLISVMLDRLQGAWIFTILDLRNAYHLIRMKECAKYKSAFCIRYGHCGYGVSRSNLRIPQLLSKPTSMIAYGLTLRTSLCATFRTY